MRGGHCGCSRCRRYPEGERPGKGLGWKAIAKALGLNLNIRAEKAKVRGLIDIWVKAGSLVVVEDTDPESRKKKKFVRVAADE